ncbi:MAG: sulfatase family protein [Bryobacteraceae bacterium]
MNKLSIMNRRQFLSGTATALIRARSGAAADRPNILWIIGDDLGAELSCYGYGGVNTPHIDRLAARGTRFTQFHTTAPVCSPSRSAFNVGLYQTTTGTQNHRSHRKDGYQLPDGARLITGRFREQGYFTCNVREIADGVQGDGKTDFNFKAVTPFDGTHWNQRKPGQPFYAQVNFQAPHKGASFVEARKQKILVDPAKVVLPPFYPDHPVVRNEVANYLDAVQLLDHQVGVLLDKLAEDQVLDNTVVFFFGDNGRCLLRGKQWLYDYGTRVPLMVCWPGVAKAGAVRDEPCHALDMTATSLMAAGIAIPANFQGRPLFGSKAKPRDFIVTARDRCDETIDRIRAVRDRRYKYIRNFMPERPYTQPNAYIERAYPTQRVIKELHAAGKLDAIQELWMAPEKPPVEFYDTHADPFEVRNLANLSGQERLVARFAKRLDDWMVETRDQGGIPESKEELDQWMNRTKSA